MFTLAGESRHKTPVAGINVISAAGVLFKISHKASVITRRGRADPMNLSR